MTAPALSIVVPAYSEERYLGDTLAALRAYLGDRGWLATTEVIVVTADSADRTQAIARDAIAAFPRARHLEPGAKVGKGRDVRAGMLAATGDIVLFMDADRATPLHHIGSFVDRLRAGDADIAIGSRDLKSIHADWIRTASSQLANRLVQTLLLPGVTDTQCGFKAFRGELVRPLFAPLQTLGWGFDFEILGRARLAGHHIVEIPLADWADPKGNHGLVGEVAWKASLRTLRELISAWIRLNGPIARVQRVREARTRRASAPPAIAVRAR